MTDQLRYNELYTLPISVQMPREDDRHFDFFHKAGPASAIKEAYFKLTLDGVDVLVLTLENEGGQWDLTVDNFCRIWIKHADTTGLSHQATYRVGVEFILQNDLHYTPVLGSFLLQDDIINDGDTAPYLTWQTRSTFQDLVDAYADELMGIRTCNRLTVLAADALASDTSITVENGTICPAGSVVRIMLNDDTYDERTINTQVGNVLTFTGGLSDDADSNKVVRRV